MKTVLSSLVFLLLSGVLLIPYLMESYSYFQVKSRNPPHDPQISTKNNNFSWLRRQHDMKRRIKETCQKYNLTRAGHHLTWINIIKMYRKPKIMYCINHKAGSTTLIGTMQSVLNQGRDNRITTTSPRIINKFSDFRFSFVRHPYTRLISSYEDKIVRKRATGPIGKPIREFYKRSNITFAEFITAIVVLSRENCSDRKTCGLNSHYNPFYFNCDYCRVRYHYIGKLEQWDEDILNIAKAS